MKKIASVFAFAVLFTFALNAQNGPKATPQKVTTAPASRASTVTTVTPVATTSTSGTSTTATAAKPKTTLVRKSIPAHATAAPAAKRSQNVK